MKKGLFYTCFEGRWDKLPDFSTLMPVKSGVTDDVTIKIKPSENNYFSFINFNYS
jgi:hypothetical protein